MRLIPGTQSSRPARRRRAPLHPRRCRRRRRRAVERRRAAGRAARHDDGRQYGEGVDAASEGGDFHARGADGGDV